MAKYEAKIQFLDSEGVESEIVSTDDVNEATDDQIFFYFEDEKEIDNFKTEGNHDFRVIDYQKIH